jgi:thiamine-monophosphate kinase
VETDPALLPLVLSGGDDYELLFAAPPERSEEVLARAAAAGTAVTPVGAFVEGPPEVVARGADGAPIAAAEQGGWSHF